MTTFRYDEADGIGYFSSLRSSLNETVRSNALYAAELARRSKVEELYHGSTEYLDQWILYNMRLIALGGDKAEEGRQYIGYWRARKAAVIEARKG